MWTVGEHLLASVSDWLAELTYITAVVNSDQKAARRMSRPEPIVRPGQEQAVSRDRMHPRHRSRSGPQIDPASIGGAPIETTAIETG